MHNRKHNASQATTLAVSTVATAALAGIAGYFLTGKKNVAGLTTGIGALLGLGVALHQQR